MIIYRFLINTGLLILNSVALGFPEIATREASLQTLGVGGVFLVASVCLGNLWIRNFGNKISNSTEGKYFLVTPKLIEVAKVLIGSSLSLEVIDSINRGAIDLLSGIILTTSFSKDVDGLGKFEIQTKTGNIFTFVKNDKVSNQEEARKFGIEKIFVATENLISNIRDCFSPENRALTVVGNLDLLNRSRIIRIKNLNAYEKEIVQAFNFGQPITCIYDRVRKTIYALQVKSKEAEKPALEMQSQAQQVNQESTRHIPLPIDLEFAGNFTENQMSAFRQAAQRWGSIIHNNLIPVTIDGKRIEGISITASALEIDGPHNRLAQAGPVHLRPGSLLPATGIIEFDSADLKLIEENGSLLNVIIHEMAHVLGFGTLWEQKGLLQGVGTDNPTFIGENAMSQYAKLIGTSQTVPVPVEHMGYAGTQYDHWRESIFEHEIMTGFIGCTPNPLSYVTLASLQDLGYLCNLEGADAFEISNTLELSMQKNSKKNVSKKCCCKYDHNNSESAIVVSPYLARCEV